MNSPIPEPGALDPSQVPPKPIVAHGPRPPLIKVLTGIELAMFAVREVVITPVEGDKLWVAIISLFWCCLLYLLWCGRNWVRVFILVFSAIGVVYPFMELTGVVSNSPPRPVILILCEAILACAWVHVLMSRPAIEFAKGIPEQLA